MADIAALGITVTSDGAVKATSDLDRLKRAASSVEGSTERLGRAATRASGGLNTMAGSTERLARNLIRTASAIATGMLTRALVNMADAWSELNDRVELVSSSQAQASAVMAELQDIARRTRSPIQDVTEAWIDNQRPLRDMGATTRETLKFTEALSTALDLSAIRGQRAATVTDALSRAMATGRLSGIGLNTVIGQGGMVAELLAKELGTTVSGLRQMGADGKITADVIKNALIRNLDDLRTAAAQGTLTLRDGFEVLGNALMQFVGNVDRANGLTSAFGWLLITLADNIERVAAYAVAFGAFMAGRWVVSFVAARGATTLLTGSLVALRAAVIASGFGALIVGAGELVHWFSRLVTAAGGFKEALRLLWNAALEVFDRIKLGVGGVAQAFSALVKSVSYWWANMLAQMTRQIYSWGHSVATVLAQVASAIGGRDVADIMADVPSVDTVLNRHGIGDASQEAAAAAAAWNTVGETFERMVAPLESWQTLQMTIANTGTDGADALDDAAASAARLSDALDGSGSGGGAKGSADKFGDAMRDLNAEIERYNILLTQGELGARIWEAQRDAGVEALSVQGRQIEAAVRQLDMLEQLKAKTDEWKSTIQDAFVGFVTGAKSFRQAVVDIIAKLAEMMAMKAFEVLWGGGAMGGGIGGGIGGFIGKLFGFADGTSSAPGGMAWVGERGPELVSLPPGARVYNAQASRDMARQGQAGGTVRVIIEEAAGFAARVRAEAQGVAVQVVSSAARQQSDQKYLTGAA